MFSAIASPCVTAAGDLENRTADDLCMIDGTGTLKADVHRPIRQSPSG